jgi:Homeodomain-like domain
MQWRIVLLFFVRGWSAAKIAARFNVPRHAIWKILNGWSVRALALGYVQIIDPVAFAACCRADLEYVTNREAAEGCLDEVPPVHNGVPPPFSDVILAAGGGSPLETPGTRPKVWPVDLPGATANPIAALDAAIAHCEEWRDELWARTATLLRELKTLAAELELRRPSEPDHLPGALRVREEERVSHAVA